MQSPAVEVPNVVVHGQHRHALSRVLSQDCSLQTRCEEWRTCRTVNTKNGSGVGDEALKRKAGAATDGLKDEGPDDENREKADVDASQRQARSGRNEIIWRVPHRDNTDDLRADPKKYAGYQVKWPPVSILAPDHNGVGHREPCGNQQRQQHEEDILMPPHEVFRRYPKVLVHPGEQMLGEL